MFANDVFLPCVLHFESIGPDVGTVPEVRRMKTSVLRNCVFFLLRLISERSASFKPNYDSLHIYLIFPAYNYDAALNVW
jgi:hypothetical protein